MKTKVCCRYNQQQGNTWSFLARGTEKSGCKYLCSGVKGLIWKRLFQAVPLVGVRTPERDTGIDGVNTGRTTKFQAMGKT